MKYSDNPLVETYDDFLSEEECQHFINILVYHIFRVGARKVSVLINFKFFGIFS